MLTEWLILQGIIERGLIFSLCIMSMYLTSRIIRFDDLSLEGSFGLGGAIMALLLSKNVPLFFAFACVAIGGALAGLATGLLHTKLKLNNLISGIVVMTALFSINLKIAGSNMILGHKATIFAISGTKMIILVPLICIVLYFIKWLLNTEIGFLWRAVGDNPHMLTHLGKSSQKYLITMLMLANALTAITGALFVQYVGYFSIWASVGMLIMTLAGLILSEAINKQFGLNILVGAILYQLIIAATFECNVDPEWNKLITALLIILMIIIKQFSASFFIRKNNHDGI